MIYLILKMFVYLLLACGIGGAAGWLLRNLQAQQSDEKARREVADAKSKVPQLESLLRGRDEQVAKLKNEIKERRQENKELGESIKKQTKEQQELARQAKSWQQKAEAKDNFSIDQGDDCADTLISELSQEIAQLKAELAATPSTNARAVADQADYAERYELVMAELDASRLQNRQLEKTLASAQHDLERQTHTVSELERERELQNKSLQVLHQQLELERSKRLASG